MLMHSVQSLIGVVAVSFFATIILFLSVYPPMLVSVESASLRNTGTVNGESSLNKMQYVYGDRIFDGNGSEVVWRGAGGSYLFHSGEDYQTAWELHLREIKAMELNTMRLAFRFPWDEKATADVLDFKKLDWVISFLAANNVKVILDNHGGMGVGSEQLIISWQQVAEHYRNDSRVVAYQLFNEPGPSTWESNITSKLDVVEYHVRLTQAVREIDPEHIVIWQTPPYYLPPFEHWLDKMQQNVVYTKHLWWTRRAWEFDIWTVQQISYKEVDKLVRWREQFKIPFWLGEFGGPGGGSSPKTYDPKDPFWGVCRELLYRAEEQVFGWNLWMGKTGVNKTWDRYLPLFPLKVYNRSLIRQPWIMPMPNLLDYMVEKQGVDKLSSFLLEMWHNKDYVTFKPGITIRVIINHKLPDETFEVVSDTIVKVSSELTIYNEENTKTHVGDWNVRVYSLGFAL